VELEKLGQTGTYVGFYSLLTLRKSGKQMGRGAQVLRSFGKQIAQQLPTFLLSINYLVKSGKKIKNAQKS
jgi:hypothetical protein